MLTLTRPSHRARALAGAALVLALVGAALTPTVIAPVDSAAAASIGGTVNSYQQVSAVSGTTVTVSGAVTGAGTPFAVGDRVVLIQMTGTAPATGSNFGNYDRTTITAISGSQITLAAITRTYSPASEAVQLVRVAYNTGTTTLTSDVTAKPWDGVTGGVIALAGDDLQLTANVNATGTGFTNANPPTTQVVASLSSGPGSVTGRGFDGVSASPAAAAGTGGGGIGGGGGAPATIGSSSGGGLAGGGQAAVHIGNPAATAAGTNGGDAVRYPRESPSGDNTDFGGGPGAGGGGGVAGGGGGGGGPYGSGGGGGVAGGGSGGWTAISWQGNFAGAGGGGVGGVGNGGNGVPGGFYGGGATDSKNEGSPGGGGGSYGGGGGVASNWRGGDDGGGGGGGGSWFGGGLGGVGGPSDGSGVVYPRGGDGNSAVGSPIPDSAHFLNDSNPRLMMGGAGGTGSADSGSIPGGSGGGIVIIDFETINGPGAIRSDGANGLSPTAFGGGGHSGSGAGAGGQMLVEAAQVQSPILVSIKGGVGGSPSANAFHAGLPGGGGGAGGVWLRIEGATATCPSTGFPNVSFDLDGGSSGPQIVNPKNGATIGMAGDGGTGLACVSPPATPPTPRVTFVKALGGDRAETGDQFRLEVREGSISGPVLGSSTTTGSGATVDAGTGRVTIDPAVTGTTYVLTEAGASGADLADYTATIACVDTAGLMSAGTGGVTSGPVPFDAAVGHAVTPVNGAAIECTVTNAPLVSDIEFDKRLVSSTQGSDGLYTVVFALDVRNTGQTTETYTLDDELRPGAGAIFQSAVWTGPTSGSFTGAHVLTRLATDRSIAPGVTDTYTVTAVYDVDPSGITGLGPDASNNCKPDRTDMTGTFAFHNGATLNWNGIDIDDDACAPFTFGFTVRKVLDGPRWMPSDQFRIEVRVGSITGPLAGSSTTTGSGETVDPNTGVVRVDPAVSGQTYVLTEVGSSGAVLSDYEKTIVCIDLNGVMDPGEGGITGTEADPTGVAFDPAVGHALTPVAGAEIDCTMINRPLTSGVFFHKDLVSATRNADDTYTVVFDLVVTNTGEREETYSLTDSLQPGSGAIFESGTWVGPTQGTFEDVNVETVLAVDQPIDAEDEHTYTVTVRYRVDPPAITGSGPNASNQCKNDGVYFDESYGLHNVATIEWKETPIRDDACAPFTPPKLALTGAALGSTAVLAGAVGLVLSGGVLLAILLLRRRRRDAASID